MNRICINTCAATFVLLSLLTGCASGKIRYAPCDQSWKARMGFANSTGYIDQRMGENTHQVRVGEAFEDESAELEKFALYRASEIALASGNEYFVVQNAGHQIKDHVIEKPQTTTTSVTATAAGEEIVSTTVPATMTVVQGAWYVMDYAVTNEPNEQAGQAIHRAADVQADLKYFIESRRLQR